MAPINIEAEEKGRQSPTSESLSSESTDGRKCPTQDRPSWNIKLMKTIIRAPPCIDQPNPARNCPICQKQFDSEWKLKAHFTSAHGRDFLSEQGQVSVDRQAFNLTMKQQRCAVPTFLVRVENRGGVPVQLNSIYVFDGNVKPQKVFAGKQLLPVGLGNCFEKEATLDELVLVDGRTYSVVIFGTPVIANGDFMHQIVEQYQITEESRKEKRTEFSLKELPPFEVWRPVVVLYQSNFQVNEGLKGTEKYLLKFIETCKSAQSLTPDSYRKQLHVLNQIEVCHLVQEFNGYTIHDPDVEETGYSRCYSITIKQFGKKPSLLNEEVTVKFVTLQEDKTKNIYGVITKITAKKMVVLMQKSVNVEDVIKVMFSLNRTTFQLEQSALNLMKKGLINDICFPTAVIGRSEEFFNTFQCIKPGLASNAEQMLAVHNIVNQTSFPAPYILFGPPGTGKTSTLVAAIAQIHRLRPTANILVTATSNFAANELTSRLLENIPSEDIFRYFSIASSKKMDEIDCDIIDVSNLALRSHGDICYEDIYNSRVIVTTLAMAGRLVQADIKAEHFSYIFIDECGSAKEISSLIPIAGLATNGEKIHASIVLAGDPKQLGPVFQCEFLKQTTHATSMLERLMDLPLYSKDPETREYNTKAVMLLRDSFRSHDKLLEFCNREFYDGLLRPVAPKKIRDFAVGWWRLPNRRCPLIFYPVDGVTEQDHGCTSLFNRQEAASVLFYVADLLKNGINGKAVSQSDIGIVSPYARQVIYLKQWCTTKDWCDVEVGSAEQFQGREKPIIIVSTVRSRCPSVGFLSDAKRLNVTLTRARSLLIVVGNPDTLQLDPLWSKFIEYCRVNGAIYPRKDKKANRKEMKQGEQIKDTRGPAVANSESSISSSGSDEITSSDNESMAMEGLMSEIPPDWFDHVDKQLLQEIIDDFYRVSFDM